MGNRPNLKVVLSIPRSGTFYIWSRCISSGKYQLVYDADRIPALVVLSKYCSEPLDFLYPPPVNPNFNFQYNSLSQAYKVLTAKEHVDFLLRKYQARSPKELFINLLERQKCQGRDLLVINRFVYTVSYSSLFAQFRWTIEMAIEALDLFRSWLEEFDWTSSFSLVLRRNPDWVNSMILMNTDPERVRGILDDTPAVIHRAMDMNIGIYWMDEVIQTMGKGNLDFEMALSPAKPESLEQHWFESQKFSSSIKQKKVRAAIRLGRFIQYLTEKDPIKRASLVRSIGSGPLWIFRRTPFIRGALERDLSGTILNNAQEPVLDACSA